MVIPQVDKKRLQYIACSKGPHCLADVEWMANRLKNKQHIVDTPRKFLIEKFNLNINSDPEIQIDKKLVLKSADKFKMNANEMNILLGIGGSGPSKRIPAKIFLEVIEKISKIKKCNFFLATGKNDQEQIILRDILKSKFKDLCKPLDNYLIKGNNLIRRE